MSDMTHAIEEGVGWLQAALDLAMEGPDEIEAWPALCDMVHKLDAVLVQARALLPLHPEIESAIAEERREMDEGGDRAEALRG